MPFQALELDGISFQKAETQVCVCYEEYLTQPSQWNAKPQRNHQAPDKVRHFS